MMLEDIAFNLIWLRPAWLLAIPLLLLWLWYLSKRAQGAGWQKHIAIDKLDFLKSDRTPTRYYRYFATPLVIACIALAGPALVSIPTGTANTSHATVLVFDLSPSMLARDLKPDRLTQARYKAAVILRQHEEGEIALIAYAATPTG